MAYITNNQATVEGKTLALNNSIEFSPLLNNLKGNTFQETTLGNQLMNFDPSAVNATNCTYSFSTENGLTITANGGTYNSISYSILDAVKANPNKVLKFGYGGCTLTNFSSSSNTIVQLTLTNNGTTTYKALATKSSNSAMTLTNYTIPSDTSNITQAKISVYANNSSTESTTSQTKITRPLVYLDNNSKFEKFTNGASPNPDYPQKVQNLTGEQRIQVSGKNIFNINNLYSPLNVSTTYQEIDTGVRVTTSATSTGRYITFLLGATKNFVGKTIRMKSNFTASGNNNGRYTIGYCDWGGYNYQSAGNTTISGTLISMTVDLEPNPYQRQEYIALRLFSNNTGTSVTAGSYVDYTNTIITVDNEDMTYEPYNGKTYKLNLGKNLVDLDLATIKSYNTAGTWEDNVYTYRGITYTVNNDLSVNVSSGTATGGDSFLYYYPNTSGNRLKLGAGSYTMSVNSDIPTNVNVVVAIKDSSGTTQSSTSLKSTLLAYKPQKLTQQDYELNAYINIAQNATATAGKVEFQIEQGGEPTEFSSYKTPIDLCKIDTYQDSIKKATGKNLFDKDSPNILENSIIGSDGTISASNNYIVSDYIEVQPDTKYTISYSRTSGTDGMRVAQYQSDKTFISRPYSANNPYTFTTPNDCYYIRITYLITQLTNVQLEKGEIATPYEPYGTGWYIEKQIGKVVLDGSENWQYQSSYNSFYINNNTSKGTNTPISNYFKGITSGITTNDNAVLFNTTTLYLIYHSLNGEVADLKTWLSTHNTIVYYVLANPTYIKITDTELISQLEEFNYRLKLQDKNTTILNTSYSTSPVFDLTYYTTENVYEDVIYSQDDHTRARIWFNDVEYQDFSRKCEKITKTSRIMPNDGKKVLTLSNFVATELEVILHDVNLTDIQDQVKINIETLIDEENETYQSIPLGIFNIQDSPVVNNNKITLKLRDNRVKFDFAYNAKPLIDEHGGSATKRQILEDICTQAGVEHEVDSFEFENDEIGIYDDSIKARTYIAYLAEQCGCIPTINREGKLIFIDLNHLYIWRIPLSLISKPLKIGTPFTIQRVVYEQGIIKYESSNDETLETLYINSLNPYIEDQTKINYIIDKLNGITLDSASIQKMLGNPAIDPYDLIQVYDDSQTNEPTVFTTFANNVYTFNGVNRNTFDTEIGQEQRKENVTKKTDDASFRKWATTEINNLEGTVEIQTGKITSNEEEIRNILSEFDNYATIDAVENVQNSVTQLQTDTYTKTQIQQIANGTGADGVKVTAVVSTEATFDRDGMHYAKTDAPTNSTINEKGLKVNKSSGNTELLYAGYDDDSTSATYGNSIVRTDNLTVKTYLSCANGKGRIEQFTDSSNNTGVGFFLT